MPFRMPPEMCAAPARPDPCRALEQDWRSPPDRPLYWRLGCRITGEDLPSGREML